MKWSSKATRGTLHAAAGRQLEQAAALGHAHVAIAPCREGQLHGHGAGGVVDGMRHQAVAAFVGHEQGHRLQHAPQGLPARLGLAGVVEHAPAGAGPQVAQGQQQRAVAGRARAAPFAEGGAITSAVAVRPSAR